MRYCILLFLLFVLSVYPQLNGSYTIGSGGDYATFNDALSALINEGVDGYVVFNVMSGTYTEQLTIPEITGASESNFIQFSSSGGVTLQYAPTSSSDNFVININEGDHIKFVNLTIQSITNTINRRVIVFNGTVGDIQISDCNINGLSGTGENKTLLYSSASSKLQDISIEGNTFSNGAYGIRLANSSTPTATGTVVSSNIFESTIGGAIYFTNHDGVEITWNEIDVTGYGISLVDCNESILIEKNKIVSTGIDIQGCNGTSGGRGLIANNFITANGTGIYIFNNSSYQNIYHNSVYVNTNAYAIDIANGTAINLINNIFYNEGSGYAYKVSGTSAIGTSDYNDIYSLGNYIAYWGGT